MSKTLIVMLVAGGSLYCIFLKEKPSEIFAINFSILVFISESCTISKIALLLEDLEWSNTSTNAHYYFKEQLYIIFNLNWKQSINFAALWLVKIKCLWLNTAFCCPKNQWITSKRQRYIHPQNLKNVFIFISLNWMFIVDKFYKMWIFNKK